MVCKSMDILEVQVILKMPSFFPSRAATHHSFTFGLRFLYELKRQVCLSKSVCGMFHFQLSFVFIKYYIFFLKKVCTLETS